MKNCNIPTKRVGPQLSREDVESPSMGGAGSVAAQQLKSFTDLILRSCRAQKEKEQEMPKNVKKPSKKTKTAKAGEKTAKIGSKELQKYCVFIKFTPVHTDLNVMASSEEDAVEKVKNVLGDQIEDITTEDVYLIREQTEE